MSRLATMQHRHCVPFAAAASRGRRPCRAKASPAAALQRACAAVERDVAPRLAALSASLRQHHDALRCQQQGLAQQAALLAAGLAAALSLQLGAAGGAAALDLGSAAEDSVLQALQQVEAQVGGAVDAVLSAAAPGGGGSPEEAQEARDLVQEVWEVVDSNFTDARGGGFDRAAWARLRDVALARPLHSRSAAHSAIRQMLAALGDPYSRFIAPSDFAAMLKYDVSGVGLNLGTAEEFANKTGLALPADRSPASGGAWVVGLIRGSPAEAAGLRQGDELLEVEGQPLAQRSPFEVASLLASQPEGGAAAGAGGGAGLQAPPLALAVRHLDGRAERLVLQRPLRAVKSPVAARLEGAPRAGAAAGGGASAGGAAGGSQGAEPGPQSAAAAAAAGPVGYIQLSSFNARAQRDALEAVRRLEGAGAARLVLDLRDNRGGLVTEGIEVARLFLDGDALVVRTEGKARASSAPITAPGPAATQAPLVVLVNEHTASASEILAGALRDNCRAVLAGSRTYGKGLIQSVYELHDGSGLALTVGKYVTPNGTDIDREGLAPDFTRLPSPEAADRAVAACRLARAGRGAA